MQTCCPSCQTIFRITPEQIKKRAGKVRCGQCRFVFNALDSLFNESTGEDYSPLIPSANRDQSVFKEAITLFPALSPAELTSALSQPEDKLPDFTKSSRKKEEPPPSIEAPSIAVPIKKEVSDQPAVVQENNKASKKHASRTAAKPPNAPSHRDREEEVEEETEDELSSLHAKKTLPRLFFPLVALLVLALAGQVIFHFRSELVTSFPGLRQPLEMFSRILGSPIPLPAHAELISIETSDLQTDSVRNSLVLNVTLRNRAAYGQSYPALELSLTDTQDTAIARRVFLPKEYLPPNASADSPFPADSDVAVRLWIEAKDIGAAGYRLFIFYP